MSDDLKARIADYLQRYAAWPTHTKSRALSRVLLRDCLKRIEELEQDYIDLKDAYNRSRNAQAKLMHEYTERERIHNERMNELSASRSQEIGLLRERIEELEQKLGSTER